MTASARAAPGRRRLGTAGRRRPTTHPLAALVVAAPSAGVTVPHTLRIAPFELDRRPARRSPSPEPSGAQRRGRGSGTTIRAPVPTPSGPGASSSSPPSSSVTRVRTICRPRRPVANGSRSGGMPGPASTTSTTRSRRRCAAGRRRDVGAAAVLDGVLEQLAEGHRQRGHDLRRAGSRRTPVRVTAHRARPATCRARAPRAGRPPRRRRPSRPACARASRARRAIAPTRRTASSRASRASGLSMRRACSRSSAATVCRLFFTRWWISRIVASLLSSARSRRRISVASRTSTSVAAWRPPRRSGTPRSVTTAPEFSISAPPAARPEATTASASSTGPGRRASLARRAGEVDADEVGGQPEPVVRRPRVGAREHARRPRRRAARGRRPRAAGIPCAPAAARAGTCPRRPSRRARRRPRGRPARAVRCRDRRAPSAAR